MQSARITPQVPLMINWEDQGDVTEPDCSHLKYSTIRQAGAAGEDASCVLYPVLGRRNAPREREPPTPSDWETCSGWGNRGSGSGSGIQYSILWGQKHGGVWTCQSPLTQTDLNFCFFRRCKIMRTSTSNPVSSRTAHHLTNKKHRDRLVRKEGETDAVKATPPAANSTPRCGYLAQALICVRNRHPMQRRNRRFAMHGDQCKGETSISQARLADSDAMAPG
jgi:hypothetical protein